jgi:glutaredoxin/glutathione-dependent peroxiredoxin
MIKSGDRLPSVPVRLIDANGVQETDTASILGSGTVVLFAVPGAFTPTCDTSHLPGFVANAGKLRAMGVDRIVCVAANDHHVLKAWAERSEALGSVDFIADPLGDFARALGLTKEYSDLGRRYARFAMIIRDGVVDQLFVQDASGVTVSGAPAILLALQRRAAA